MSSEDRYLVTLDPASIRKEVARAMDQRDLVCLPVMTERGTDVIRFKIGTTGHSLSSQTLDLIIGATEDGRRVQVVIPSPGVPVLAIHTTHQ